jgi:hypothetical protein
MLGKYRARSVLALTLMIAQSFLFNAAFFSYGLVLTKFYGVPENRAGLYLLPLTLSNFIGPLLHDAGAASEAVRGIQPGRGFEVALRVTAPLRYA